MGHCGLPLRVHRECEVYDLPGFDSYKLLMALLLRVARTKGQHRNKTVKQNNKHKNKQARKKQNYDKSNLCVKKAASH